MTDEKTPEPTSGGIQETLKATGRLTIVVRDEHGNIRDERKLENLVVTTGKGYIASRMKNDSGTTAVMSYMALGTGTGAAVVGDTGLGTEAGTRAALTVAGGTVSGATVTYAASFVAGNPGTQTAVTEAGIFTAGSTGTMLCRTVFPVVTKGALDTLSISWDVTIS